MLDTFTILTTSGVVLWSRSYAPISPSIINNFISDVFIEEKTAAGATKGSQSAMANPPYQSDQHTLKWAIVKELGVIFVVRRITLSNPTNTPVLTYVRLGCIPISPPPLLGRQVCGQHPNDLY